MVRHSAADLTHQVLSETGTILWERALQLATRRMDITPLALERASTFTQRNQQIPKSPQDHARINNIYPQISPSRCRNHPRIMHKSPFSLLPSLSFSLYRAPLVCYSHHTSTDGASQRHGSHTSSAIRDWHHTATRRMDITPLDTQPHRTRAQCKCCQGLALT